MIVPVCSSTREISHYVPRITKLTNDAWWQFGSLMLKVDAHIINDDDLARIERLIITQGRNKIPKPRSMEALERRTLSIEQFHDLAVRDGLSLSEETIHEALSGLVEGKFTIDLT
jgi:hypothetical protein